MLALTKTYSTVRLSAIASALDLADPTSSASLSAAASLVSSMVSRRQLFATLTPLPPPTGDAVVRFTEDPEPYISDSTASHLDMMNRREKDWRNFLVHLSREVEVNADFLKRVVKEAKDGGGPGAGYGPGGFGMGAGGGPFEDMMEVEGVNGWEEEYGS